MRGTKVKCPNKNKEGVFCGYEGYHLLQQGIFTLDSGYDPLAFKVKCRICEHIYIVFPPPNYKGETDE